MNYLDIEDIFTIPYRSKSLKTLLQQTRRDDLHLVYLLVNNRFDNLTKAELIDYILANYETLMEQFFISFTSEIWKFIDILIKMNGEWTITDEDPIDYIILLHMYLIAFPVLKSNEPTIILPKETLAYLKQLDLSKYEPFIKINDTIITYIRGLLEYYGYYDYSILQKYLKEYENIDFNLDDYFPLITNDSLIYGYCFDDNCFYLPNVEDNPNFFETRKQLQNIDYYHLSKQDIVNSHSITKEEEDLAAFLYINLDLEDYVVASTIIAIKESIQKDLSIKEILDSVDYLELSMYELKQLEKLVSNLVNNTRIWSLKGYTKNEIKMPKMIRFPKSLKKE
ncbi:MAG: hypothetical protein GX490_09515 [Bacilli bacterium]|nr:hypothetical protein [Bacilli bacterium]